ncbi:hypothetical protein JCM8097_001449 [Rhodosporidiobolus ruineniae]
MTGVAGGALAAAVHRAGAAGFIGAGHKPLDDLVQEVGKAREVLGLNNEEALPLGIGLVLFRFESPYLSTSSAEITAAGDAFLRYVLFVARARSFWMSFAYSGADGLEEWVRRVRTMEREGPKAGQLEEKERAERLRLWVMVQTEEMGKRAREWDVDAVVAQGTESGGHGPTSSAGLPSSILFSRLSPLYPRDSAPFLLSAGGLSSPSSVASALSSGAAAAVSGTAFTVASESLLPSRQKDLLIRAQSGAETVRGVKLDIARDGGKNYWPPGYCDGRGLKSLTTADADAGATDQELAARYKQAVEEKDVERLITWAGTGVGDVDAIRPANEIVQRLTSEVRA